MNRLLIVHSRPRSRRHFRLIASSDLVISFLSKSELSRVSDFTSFSKFIFLDEVAMYNAREIAKEIWNTEVIARMPLRKNLLFTNAGASRSEFSIAIQAYHAWIAVGRELKLSNYTVGVITQNKDLKNLVNLFNTSSHGLFLATLFAGVKSLFTTVKRLVIDSFYFCVLKSKTAVLSSADTKFVSFSLLKHWSTVGDWRYGEYFCENYKGLYAISCMRAGGLQNHKVSVWNNLVNECLRAENTTVIEKLVRWDQFFHCIYGVLTSQLKLFSRTIFFLRPSKKAISDLALLMLFEENRHFSEIFSNELIYLGSTNFYENMAPDKVISYHFEFPAGRAFISAANNTGVPKVLGFQHGVISKGKWCYELAGMMSKDEKLWHCAPHLYLLEGAFSWWVLSKTVEPNKIRMVGAPRQDLFPSKAQSTQIDGVSGNDRLGPSCSMVLLMDLHTTDQKLSAHIETISGSAEEVSRIYIRPHPRDFNAAIKIERVVKSFPKLAFECLTGSLHSDLQKLSGLIVWGESTGALLDCMGFGFNVKVLRPGSALILDPILDIAMDINEINIFFSQQPLFDYSPVSMQNSSEVYRLLFHPSSKLSSALVLDAFYQ